MKRIAVAAFVAAAIAARVALPAHANVCGDVNKSGAIDSVDALLILQVDAGIYEPEELGLLLWDAFPDGAVDSRDALIVLQYDAGLTDQPDCIPDPTPTPLPI
jgi:hypothetical protein